MSETKHTPGPWKNDGLRVWAKAPDGDSIYICSLKFISDTKVSYEQAEANTQLLAAAPDLLKVCKTIVDHYQSKWRIDDRENYQKAKDALDKALGNKK